MSLLGCVLLLAALIYGKTVSETPTLAAYFDLKGETLALIIMATVSLRQYCPSGCFWHPAIIFRHS